MNIFSGEARSADFLESLRTISQDYSGSFRTTVFRDLQMISVIDMEKKNCIISQKFEHWKNWRQVFIPGGSDEAASNISSTS